MKHTAIIALTGLFALAQLASADCSAATAGLFVFNPPTLKYDAALPGATFTVQLAQAPTQQLQVALNLDGFMLDLNMITFTNDNWNQPQKVAIVAPYSHAVSNAKAAPSQLAMNLSINSPCMPLVHQCATTYPIAFTPAVGKTCSISGDPWLVGLDGVSSVNQADVGTFYYLKSDFLEVQGLIAVGEVNSMGGDPTVLLAVSVRYGDTVFLVDGKVESGTATANLVSQSSAGLTFTPTGHGFGTITTDDGSTFSIAMNYVGLPWNFNTNHMSITMNLSPMFNDVDFSQSACGAPQQKFPVPAKDMHVNGLYLEGAVTNPFEFHKITTKPFQTGMTFGGATYDNVCIVHADPPAPVAPAALPVVPAALPVVPAAAPVAPAAPLVPAAPAVPLAPVVPAAPLLPAVPAVPLAPVAPVAAPAAPAAPLVPAAPAVPLAPVAPVAAPVLPAAQLLPAVPAVPLAPVAAPVAPAAASVTPAAPLAPIQPYVPVLPPNVRIYVPPAVPYAPALPSDTAPFTFNASAYNPQDIQTAQSQCSNLLQSNGCPQLSSTNFNTIIQNCMQDIVISGSHNFTGGYLNLVHSICAASADQILNSPVALPAQLVTHAVTAQQAAGYGTNACPNNCSGHGACSAYGCQCYDAFTGIDCSTNLNTLAVPPPSSFVSVQQPIVSSVVAPAVVALPAVPAGVVAPVMAAAPAANAPPAQALATLAHAASAAVAPVKILASGASGFGGGVALLFAFAVIA
ncbi:hypothetical protein HDU98_000505 [Podochytrium sp. JEL0797]|nr:hypothetical protein HDU98_000505 [Podochytrium sp. JEL0797]